MIIILWLSLFLTISPLVRPMIVFPMPGDHVVVTVTNNAMFSCTAMGLPVPTISWQLNGVNVADITSLTSRLPFSSLTVMVMDTPNGTIFRAERTLTIINVAANDANVYTCVATIDTIPDNDTQDFELYVQSKFLIIPINV